MESNTVNEVIDALKAIVRSALCQRFSKTSYIVTNYIKYIKNIQHADEPERFISIIAKKLFPNSAMYAKRLEYIRLKYKDDLLQRLEELYVLYYRISQENIPERKNVSETEADNILAELLF